MIYTAPQQIADHRLPAVFLAGGISNCDDWQHLLVDLFDSERFDVFNPRRPGGLEKDGDEARRQIEWEFDALGHARTIVFWFPASSICPITLYEYGAALQRAARGECRVIAAWDASYQRAFDLDIQTALVRSSSTSCSITVCQGEDAFAQLKQAVNSSFGKKHA